MGKRDGEIFVMRLDKSELHDFDLHFHLETDKAILVSENGIRDAAFFLPKSRITFEMRGKGSVHVTCPEWLALEKGLL